jgi:RNA polymerase sporulation-specific sigma factor
MMDVPEKNTGIEEDGLVALAATGDEEALDSLFRAYRNVIRGKANLYFLAGGDKDDLIQEGMIGLFRAIMDYDNEAEASFRTFAELCISRQMITAVRTADRLKHSPLNTSLSIHGSAGTGTDDNADKIEDILEDKTYPSPEEALIARDQARRLEEDSVKLFSKLELAVWDEFRRGRTYKEIAIDLNKPLKTVDNAIQRMKKKVEKHMDMY